VITSETRHFTASAVVVDHARRKTLLVAHRAEGRVQYPSGHVDPDDRPHITALREVTEETGVNGTVIPTHPTNAVPGSWTFPTPLLVCERPAPAKPHKGEPAHHHIDLLYVIEADSTNPLTHQPDENDFAVWVDYDNALVGPHGDIPGLREDVPAQLAAALRFLATVEE
jgi:8-oxo-dGTP pyrophosphatase MutT (NUDIX family)